METSLRNILKKIEEKRQREKLINREMNHLIHKYQLV